MSNQEPPQDPRSRPEMGQNPFDNPRLDPGTRPSSPTHASDHPGREYAIRGTDVANDRHPSSGASGPSEPRRPGLNERQAPRRSSADTLGAADPVVPGELLLRDEPVVINDGCEVTMVR